MNECVNPNTRLQIGFIKTTKWFLITGFVPSLWSIKAENQWRIQCDGFNVTDPIWWIQYDESSMTDPVRRITFSRLWRQFRRKQLQNWNRFSRIQLFHLFKSNRIIYIHKENPIKMIIWILLIKKKAQHKCWSFVIWYGHFEIYGTIKKNESIKLNVWERERKKIDWLPFGIVTGKRGENGDTVRMRKSLTVRSLADALRVEALLMQLSAGGRRWQLGGTAAALRFRMRTGRRRRIGTGGLTFLSPTAKGRFDLLLQPRYAADLSCWNKSNCYHHSLGMARFFLPPFLPPSFPPPSISAHSNRVWRHNHSTTSRNLNPTTLKEKITGDCLLASRLVQQNRQTSMILFFLSWKNQRPDNSIHNPSQRNYRKLNKPYQFWFSLPIQRSN